MPQKTDAVIAELMDRRLLNDVDPDLHQEIAKAVVKAVHTASLQCEDAVERVARIMGLVEALLQADCEFEQATPGKDQPAYENLKAARAELERSLTTLATGLVPNEAAVRAAHIKVLRGLLYSCAEQANVTGPDKTTGRHMINLIDTIERSPDMPIDKIARWTGFIQGVLAARGLLDVDAERDRTRPIFAAAIRSGGGE